MKFVIVRGTIRVDAVSRTEKAGNPVRLCSEVSYMKSPTSRTLVGGNRDTIERRRNRGGYTLKVEVDWWPVTSGSAAKIQD